jgi:biopolymer transport protein ExbB/TolQ
LDILHRSSTQSMSFFGYIWKFILGMTWIIIYFKIMDFSMLEKIIHGNLALKINFNLLEKLIQALTHSMNYHILIINNWKLWIKNYNFHHKYQSEYIFKIILEKINQGMTRPMHYHIHLYKNVMIFCPKDQSQSLQFLNHYYI